MRRFRLLVCASFLCVGAPLRAQTPPDLLALVPKEFGFCMAVHDLRGHWQRMEQTPWVTALRQTSAARALLAAPEFAALTKFHQDLQRHLEIDWPTVRDEVVGDLAVFAYCPPDAAGNGEQGLLLVKARQPEVLQRLIDRLNRLQMKSGELKALDEQKHRDTTYYRRVHQKAAPWWYFAQGSVFALASKEATLKAVIEQPREPAPIRSALRKAGAEQALAVLWLNPRTFDAELKSKGEKSLPPDAQVLGALLKHWQGLEAIVVTCDVKQDIEIRLSLLGRPGEMPATAKAWFTRRGPASELWQRFPDSSVLTLAGRTDFRALADGLLELAPETVRKLAVEGANSVVGAALQLDLFRDVLPNLGPDWGICLLPADAGKEFPQVLVALAVKPGDKKPGVDQSIYSAAQFFGGLALLDYNRKLPLSEHIRMLTLHKDGVEIKYLAQDRLFPAGLQPAMALKEGYLLLGTSPTAIGLFRRSEKQDAAADEVLMVRFAPGELARLLRHHRASIVEQLAQKNGQSKAVAELDFDRLLSMLDLCRSVTLSQRAGDHQLAWTVRLRMADGNSP